MPLFRLTIGSGRIRTHVTIEAENKEDAIAKGVAYDDREVTAIKEVQNGQ